MGHCRSLRSLISKLFGQKLRNQSTEFFPGNRIWLTSTVYHYTNCSLRLTAKGISVANSGQVEIHRTRGPMLNSALVMNDRFLKFIPYQNSMKIWRSSSNLIQSSLTAAVISP